MEKGRACGRKRGEAVQRSHKRALVWVTIQIGVSLVPPHSSPTLPSLLARRSLPVSSGQPSAIVRRGRRERASRNLSLVENHRGNKVKAPSGTSRYRIPNRNYEPAARGLRARRTERTIDRPLSSPRKIEGRKVNRSRRTPAITVGEKREG